MYAKTIAGIARDLASGKYSSEELTKDILQQIKKVDAKLNSFITITEEKALAAARAADQRRRIGGNVSALTGIPIAHKDNFYTKGVKTTCASKVLKDFIAPYDATVVAKLNAAGSVTVGKTNMDEFAMGSSSEHGFYGAVKNPWNLECVPGGSSGGSAAAVAARLVAAATGSDAGGSTRQPAALCGITGLKPTYGRVSRHGMIMFAPSFDHVGVLATTAEDIALILNFICGYDKKDCATVNAAVPDYTKAINYELSNITIGLPKEYFAQNLNANVAITIEQAISELKKLGIRFQDISLPHAFLALPTYHIIAAAESALNLMCYSEKNYGRLTCDPYAPIMANEILGSGVGKYIHSTNVLNENFGSEVKRRIITGNHILTMPATKDFLEKFVDLQKLMQHISYDNYNIDFNYYFGGNSCYLQAQNIRKLINDDFQKALKNLDIILSPTAASPAFKIGEKTANPADMYLSDLYTVAANLTGLPAVSVPVGFVKNLPVGMQLIGNYFADDKILNIAHKYQQVTNWHNRMPDKQNFLQK